MMALVHRLWSVRVLVAVAALGQALAPSASAHETLSEGPFRLEIGWEDEPAFTGQMNAVQVRVSTPDGAEVDAVEGLRVEVSFGNESRVMPLVPTGRRGEARARLIPTEPGTYTFRVTGSLQGQRIDVRSTCSEKTFDCVSDIADMRFPPGDGSEGDTVARLDRELQRADDRAAASSTTRQVAVGAAVLATLALAATLVLWLRRRRGERNARPEGERNA
jgi:hypothetical protein